MANRPIWVHVPGYEGRYSVSSDGHIRSLSTYRPNCGGILATWQNCRGYHYVTLRDASGAKKAHGVHRVVLSAFIGPCPLGKQAAHNNGDVNDNRLANLRWATAKENSADRRAHGRTVIGEAQASAKLDRHAVKTIKKMKVLGFSAYETARLACVHPTTIDRIWAGETWKHV